MVIPHNESHILNIELSKITIAFIFLITFITIFASLLSVFLQERIENEAGELYNVNETVMHEREHYLHSYSLLKNQTKVARNHLNDLFEQSEYYLEDDFFFSDPELLYNESQKELNREALVFKNEIENYVSDDSGEHKLSRFTASIIGDIDKSLVTETFSFEPAVIAFRKLHKEITELESAIKSYKVFIQERMDVQGDLPYFWVVNGGKYSSFFGTRVSPFGYERVFHAGVDLADQHGTAIYAAADGKVVLAGVNGGYGLAVKVKHRFGYETLYAHLSSVKVYSGKKVKKGQVIGRMGATGRATGVHLHYEVRILNKAINPLPFLTSS